MYSDEEKLDRHKNVWLTEECYKLLRAEKKRLENLGRKVSMQKIVNNLILESLQRRGYDGGHSVLERLRLASEAIGNIVDKPCDHKFIFLFEDPEDN
jgi:hypothetical protein